MNFLDTASNFLPQVDSPAQKKLNFAEKFKWTMIVLVIYFVLKKVYLFGLDPAGKGQFEQIAVLLGAEFGTLVSLGIGPIVTASIILQLLNGAQVLQLIGIDTHTHTGKARFQTLNKLTALAMIVIESVLYVMLGGIPADKTLLGTSIYPMIQFVLIFQLILGGIIILLLDDVLSKWGFGSGISLFIAAGVSESLFIQLFSWIPPAAGAAAPGALVRIFEAVISPSTDTMVIIGGALAAIIATIVVFGLAVYFQSMKVEIPLSFGRVRGYGIRWPLSFLYTSNIPVILIAALLANIQLFSQILSNSLADSSLGSGFIAGAVQSIFPAVTTWGGAIAAFGTLFQAPNLIQDLITNGLAGVGAFEYVQALFYSLLLICGSMLFAYLWMQTSGMDASSQAKQIMQSGLQIPGFRSDPRMMETVLSRYITPLTIMGGFTVGVLAAFADIAGALTNGTGLLLAVMIIYKLYEDIAKQHMSDMNPMLRQFMGGK